MYRNRIAVWSSAGIALFAIAMIFALSPVATIAQNKAGRNKPADPETAAGPKKVVKSDGEWLKILSRDQFYVTRKGKDEPPGMGKNWSNKKDGVYVCACCKHPLFDSTSKFDGKQGYPCFHETIEPDAVTIGGNKKIQCNLCDAYLGTTIAAGGGGQGGGGQGGGPQNQQQQQQQEEQRRQEEQKRQDEQRRQEEQRRLEEQRKQEEQRRQEEQRKQEQDKQKNQSPASGQPQTPNAQPATGGQPGGGAGDTGNGGQQPASPAPQGENAAGGGQQPAPAPSDFCIYNQAVKFVSRSDFKAGKRKPTK